MAVRTTYDEKRDRLRESLKDCLEQARDLLDESVWGYEDMRKGYAFELYIAVKNAKDTV
ncbi:hypothetical protein D3C78_1623590 [compost metagenome]